MVVVGGTGDAMASAAAAKVEIEAIEHDRGSKKLRFQFKYFSCLALGQWPFSY